MTLDFTGFPYVSNTILTHEHNGVPHIVVSVITDYQLLNTVFSISVKDVVENIVATSFHEMTEHVKGIIAGLAEPEPEPEIDFISQSVAILMKNQSAHGVDLTDFDIKSVPNLEDIVTGHRVDFDHTHEVLVVLAHSLAGQVLRNNTNFENDVETRDFLNDNVFKFANEHFTDEPFVFFMRILLPSAIMPKTETVKMLLSRLSRLVRDSFSY